jgi:CheY-like chemotaxis protein
MAHPGRLVLVVDDNDDVREMYAEYLSFKGFRAETACDGQRAVEKALELRPDVIVMDLAMPVMTGIEAAVALGRRAETSSIPIIAVTGHGRGLAGARSGLFVEVLEKPVTPDLLVAAIRRARPSRPD